MKLDAKKVKELLNSSRHSRATIAHKMGMSESTLNHMACGRMPHVQTLAKFAAIVGCRWIDLILETNTPKKGTH